jgi:DNA-binding NarL/FixJ family response regulator
MALFIIDDHPLMREAVSMLLRKQSPGAQVVELDRLGAVEPAVRIHGEPELICLDLKLPDSHGVSGVREIRSRFPKVPLAVISAAPAYDYEDLCHEAGADVFIEKSAGASEISSALRALLTPDSGFAEISEFADPAETKLSRRQLQLLLMLDQGLSNRNIADHLQISEHTVKVHLWRLFRRINVKSRTQAVHHARTHGLLTS